MSYCVRTQPAALSVSNPGICRKEDYDRAKVLINDAARSGSYLYPIKGILYFATHKPLWKPLLSTLAPQLALSAGVVTSMFFFTCETCCYPPFPPNGNH